MHEETDGVCCCEYINYRGEKAHVLATLCDCELIDNMVERCISHRSFSSSDQYKEAYNVIQDRVRIPWCFGGARRVDLQLFIPLVTIPLCLCLAAQGVLSTVIIFIFIWGTLLVTYGWCWLQQYKTQFFLYWFEMSFAILIGVFQTQVVPFLEIELFENLSLMLLVLGMLVVLYFVRIKALIVKSEEKVDSLELRTCSWSKYCFSKSDHHCLWMNCYIGAQNQVWFILGLFLTASSTFYVSNLTYTTLCQPVLTFWDLFLIPYDCSDVYNSFHTALSFVSGVYATTIGFMSSSCILHEVLILLLGSSLKKRCRNI